LACETGLLAAPKHVANIKMSQSTTAAFRHPRRKASPTRDSHGARQMDVILRAHQLRSMDAKFGPGPLSLPLLIALA
jgi:hypothetical protein